MARKKYRWNPRKCGRNMASLLIRTLIAAVMLIALGSGPAIADAPDSAGNGAGRVEIIEVDKEPAHEENSPQIENLTPQEQPEEPAYTQEELDLLARVIAGEALGCDDTEQLYVGSVVLNRIAHHLYPDTMEGVVSQKSQYGCYRNGTWSKAAQNPSERCYENARYLLENGSVLPGNVVFQAPFRQGDGVYVQTKWHIYCYTNR